MASAQAHEQGLELLPGLLLWIAPTGESIGNLPSWYAFTGQHQGAPAGHEGLEAIHPEDGPEVEARWANAQTAAEPFISTFRLRRANGVYLPITLPATPVLTPAGVVSQWVGWGPSIPPHPLAMLALITKPSPPFPRARSKAHWP